MSDTEADTIPSVGSKRRVRHDISKKKKALRYINEHNWISQKASQKLKVPCSTIRNWVQHGDAIRDTIPAPLQKRLGGSGRFSNTHNYEGKIVNYVMVQATNEMKLSRSDIFLYCDVHVPNFSWKTHSAKKSSMSRMVSHHNLQPYLVPFSKRRVNLSLPNQACTEILSAEANLTEIPVGISNPMPTKSVPVTPAPSPKLPVTSTMASGTVVLAALNVSVMASKTIVVQESDSEGTDDQVFVGSVPASTFVGSDSVVWSSSVSSFTRDCTAFPTVTVVAPHLLCLKPNEWLENAVIDYYIHQHIPCSPQVLKFRGFRGP